MKTSEFVHWDLFKISLKDNVGLSDFLKDSGFPTSTYILLLKRKCWGKTCFEVVSTGKWKKGQTIAFRPSQTLLISCLRLLCIECINENFLSVVFLRKIVFFRKYCRKNVTFLLLFKSEKTLLASWLSQTLLSSCFGLLCKYYTKIQRARKYWIIFLGIFTSYRSQ